MFYFLFSCYPGKTILYISRGILKKANNLYMQTDRFFEMLNLQHTDKGFLEATNVVWRHRKEEMTLKEPHLNLV